MTAWQIGKYNQSLGSLKDVERLLASKGMGCKRWWMITRTLLSLATELLKILLAPSNISPNKSK